MFLNVPLSLALHRFGLILFFKFLFPDIISAMWSRYSCISEPFLGWSFLDGCFLWGRCHLTWFSQLFHLPQEGVVSGSLCWHDGCNDSIGYSAFRVQWVVEWFSSSWRVSMLWMAGLFIYSSLGCCSRGVMLSVYFSKMISILIVPINSSFIIIVVESSCFRVFFYAVAEFTETFLCLIITEISLLFWYPIWTSFVWWALSNCVSSWKGCYFDFCCVTKTRFIFYCPWRDPFLFTLERLFLLFPLHPQQLFLEVSLLKECKNNECCLLFNWRCNGNVMTLVCLLKRENESKQTGGWNEGQGNSFFDTF